MHPLGKQSSELVVYALVERLSGPTQGIIVRGMCSTGLHASLAREAPVERSIAGRGPSCSGLHVLCASNHLSTSSWEESDLLESSYGASFALLLAVEWCSRWE